MNITRYCLVALTFLLLSCDGGNDKNHYSPLEIQLPETIRQIMALNDNEMVLEISVNARPDQFFRFSSGTSSFVAAVEGIAVGQPNSVSLTWIEVYNGFEIEISTQDQTFFAEGDTLINAPHVHTQYDYDNDSMSNYDERQAGTCVWSASENCARDVPSDNAVLNGDFSHPNEYWWSTVANNESSSGDYCMSTNPDMVNLENAQLGYEPQIFLDAGSDYTIIADIKAQRPSSLAIRLVAPPPVFISLHSEIVQISTDYQRVSARFSNTSNRPAYLVFQFGDGTTNLFCFDNIRMIKE